MEPTVQDNLPTVTVAEDQGPVPLSFPSILRNPGLTSRFAHLVEPTQLPPDLSLVQSKKVWRRNDNEGKRWVRRRENGAYSSSYPHPRGSTNVQLTSRTIHTSQRPRSGISNLPYRSNTLHSPFHSHLISRVARRFPPLFLPYQTLRRAMRDNSVSPCVGCARLSGALALARRHSCVASKTS
jgi:hypothetical protein